jgi:tetratricopeptide (TPR) repeat protein/tRNA A-37 threonylcarbamoyl transferase component Bud32
VTAQDSKDWWDLSDSSADADVETYGYDYLGKIIGRYRVIDSLGTGGMGQVFLAERADDEFRQRVAIKLVRSGLVSKQVRTRLRIERQILAQFNHPNIARLLDGGTTEEGIPYIVMEYIDGTPIDVYCDEHRLSIRERLALFRTVCAAVHYAHQNLVVHRDLKPSNILVTRDGVPKLLDFGIAKLLDSHQIKDTLAVTHFDSRLLTPDHASPEQVRGDLVTTASDTYVLGVLLYELLTGRKPFRLKGTGLGEIARAICEQAPLPLSHGLNSAGRLPDVFLEEICEARQTTPARLRKELSGDLQNIVSMALRKEPERRYSSVEQFSADIERYLSGLPVLARKDTWTYRTRKFLGRHAIAAASAALAIIALVAFTLVTAIQAKRIEAARDRAEHVARFLVNIFEQATPEQRRGRDITAHQMLRNAAARLEHDLDTQPQIRALLSGTLGSVYASVGDYDKAQDLLRTALQMKEQEFGVDSAEVAEAKLKLGRVLRDLARLDEAEALIESSLGTYRHLFGENSAEVAAGYHQLAGLRQEQEQLDESERLYQRSITILESSPKTDVQSLATYLNEWAVLRSYRADFQGAEALYRRALQAAAPALGHDHPIVATTTHNLAVALDRQGKRDAARPLYDESIRTYEKVFGTDHPETAWALANYGRFLQKEGDYGRAEELLRSTVDAQTRIYGAEHTNTGYAHVNLGLLFLESGRAQLAHDELITALGIYARELPADHQYVGAALLGLGRAELALGRPEEASRALVRAEQIAARAYATGSPALASIRAAQGGALVAQGRFAQAEPLLKESYPILLSVRGREDAYTKQVERWITQLYKGMGQGALADEYFASHARK